MEKIKKKSRFRANKINFLEENYSNEVTKNIYYDTWESCINYLEEIKQKDLYQFNSEEIQELMSTIPTASTSRKGNILTFISNYFEYCIEKGLANTNPTQALDRDLLTRVNSKAIKSKMLTKKQVHELCIKMAGSGHVFQVLPFILARYGVMGDKLDSMINLRWEDVDRENMKVYIMDRKIGEIYSEFDIDELFLYWIDRAKKAEEYEVRKYYKTTKKEDVQKVIKFIDYGYVLKVTDSNYFENSITQDADYIYREMIKVANASKIKKPTLNNLVKAEKIERLLEIRENRKLTTDDVFKVVKEFDPKGARSNYTTLRRDYESLTKDMVYPSRSSLEQLRDDEAQKHVKEFWKEIFGE